ncbi:MAG: alpha/beta hydrolase [Paracoccaceae bacterium]
MKPFHTADGLQLDYTDQGQGPAVLCLPGLTRDLYDFDELAATLTSVRLLRLTPRGRRGSDWAEHPTSYNIAAESADSVAFLDFLGVEKAVVIGTSRGGLQAMAMAATVPERLAGVVLNDIGPELAPDGLGRIMDYLGIAPRAQTLPDLVAALQANMGAGFPGLSAEKWSALARRWFDVRDDGIGLTYDPKIRDAVIAQSATPVPDLWPLFDLLPTPLAVIRGANSDLLTAETVARMKARRPGLITAEVRDRGHVPFLDEPESRAAIHAVLEQI